jgi:hypothetical protein
MANSLNEKKFASQFSKVAGFLGAFTSVMLMPFVFERILAVDELLAMERRNLWIFSTILLIFSIWLLIFNKKNKLNLVLTFFVFILIVGTELTTRVVVNLIASKQTLQELTNYVNRTYPEFLAFDGHPFTSFMGKSNKTLQGTEITGGFKPFNNFGFVGNDFEYKKKDGTIRVAALGASTTARGYPALLENILNNSGKMNCRFEVMNFGVTGWTTAHTMINFMLNVVEFNPDYIIIHHGWNENKVRNYPDNVFRGDYSHAFTYFHEPEIADKIPLRISVIYRLLKMKFSGTSMPSWMFVGKSTSIVNENPVYPMFKNLDELKPFNRNINTIIKIALSNNYRVILTSQPHSTDPNILQYGAARGIDQTNSIIRTIKSMYKDEIIYVELDTLMSGKANELFVDIGHLNEEGKRMKAKYIAEKIIADTSWLYSVCNSNQDNQFFVGLNANEISLINYFKNKIVAGDVDEIEQLAQEEGLDFETVLLHKAKTQLQLLTNSDKERIFRYVINIRNNPKWYNDIVEKADNRGITAEEMTMIDAMALFQKEKNGSQN